MRDASREQEIKRIVGLPISKRQRFAQLRDIGLTTSQIAKLMDVSYAQVYVGLATRSGTTKTTEPPARQLNVDSNAQYFLDDLHPDGRYASFDYCYNYFQSFRDESHLPSLSYPANLQQSCLQLGFYLASWGMFRGSTFLLQKSARFFAPLIGFIADADPTLWQIDVDRYTDENVDRLLRCESEIAAALSKGGDATPTLVTKIMLGVFGNVPAFDTFFVAGSGIRWTGRESLRRVAKLYEENKSAIDRWNIATLDFASGQETHRKYPKVKVVDMVCFIEGAKAQARASGSHINPVQFQ